MGRDGRRQGLELLLQPARREEGKRQPLKVLIVDDSPDITDLLVKVLATVGHEVAAANNGREGLDMATGQKFDAVFLDIAMPDFSGLDFINELERKGRLKDSTVVLFTASSITDAEVGELVKRGVHSCLRKPVQIETLFNKMEEIASTHPFHEEPSRQESGGSG